MEFLTVAREIERLAYHLTYSKDNDLFYDTKGRPMIYDEQWKTETEILKELKVEEQEIFLNLLAHLCPGA